MKIYKLRFPVLLLIPLLLSTNLFARFNIWEPQDGVTVRQGAHIYWSGETSVAVNHLEQYCVVWSDSHTGSQEIYAKCFDADDNELWPSAGVQLTSHVAAQNDPVVIALEDGSWVVGWRDFRNDLEQTGSAQLYLQRVSTTGEPLWEDGGIAMTSPVHPADVITLLPSTDNNLLACWSVSNLLTIESVNDAGSTVWPEPLQIDENCYNQQLLSDNEGGALMLFVQSEGWSDCLSVNRLDPDGNLLWGDEASGILVTPDVTNFYEALLFGDGTGGALIVWRDHPAEEYLVSGQHVTSDGTVNWTDGGSALVSCEEQFSYFTAATSAPGELVVAWTEHVANQERCLKAQRVVSASGEPLLEWNEGITVDSGLSSGWGMFVKPDDTGGAVIGNSWLVNQGLSTVTRFHHYDQSGIPLWSEPVVLEAEAEYQGTVSLVQDNDFKLFRKLMLPDIGGIYFNSFSLNNGDQLLPGNGLPTVEGIQNDTSDPIITLSGSSTYIAWEDWRAGQQGVLPYVQRLDLQTGTPLWVEHGINLVPGWETGAGENCRYLTCGLQLEPDGEGGIISIFYLEVQSDSVDLPYYPCLQRLDPSGEPLWGERGIAITSDTSAGYSLPYGQQLLPLFDGGILVIYMVDDDAGVREVRGQRFLADGTAAWGPWGRCVFVPEGTYFSLQKAVQLEDGSIMLLGRNLINSTSCQFTAMKISDQGDQLWDELMVLLDLGDLIHIRSLQTELIDNQLLMFLKISDGAYSETRLVGQYLGNSGLLPWGSDGVELVDETHFVNSFDLAPRNSNSFWLVTGGSESIQLQSYNLIDFTPVGAEPVEFGSDTPISGGPRLVADLSGGVYAFWNIGTNWLNTDYHYLHVTANSEYAHPDYSPAGIALTTAWYQQQQLSVCPDGEGGVLTCWNDYRGRRGDMEEDDVYAMRVNDLTSEDVVPFASPDSWHLSPPYPNPFNPVTNISLTVPFSTRVTLTVFDLLGREVVRLLDGQLNAGVQLVKWDGRANDGVAVASGIYIYRMEGGGEQQSRRMILLK